MTIQELMAMPIGFSPDEWKEELNRRKKIQRKIAKLNDDICWEEDALKALNDEIGSDRWMKHNNAMYNKIVKRDELIKEMEGWK